MKRFLQFSLGFGASLTVGLIVIFLWNDPTLSKEFILGLVSLGVTVYGLAYSHRKEKEKENAARLFSQKAESYNKVFEMVGSLMAADKIKSKKITEKQLLEYIFEIKNNFLVWGSEQTIKAFEKISDPNISDNENERTKILMKNMGDLYLAMRKDLGHNDVNMTPYEIIGFYLNAEAKKELLNK